jgi:hypothetical protein
MVADKISKPRPRESSWHCVFRKVGPVHRDSEESAFRVRRFIEDTQGRKEKTARHEPVVNPLQQLALLWTWKMEQDEECDDCIERLRGERNIHDVRLDELPLRNARSSASNLLGGEVDARYSKSHGKGLAMGEGRHRSRCRVRGLPEEVLLREDRGPMDARPAVPCCKRSAHRS